MKEVFMPLNEEMSRIVIEHSDLLDEEEMPNCLLLLNAHVLNYKAVIKAWELGDYTQNTAIVNFPKDLQDYTTKMFRILKERQRKLM
ncbi:MAG: hypothetical protein ACW99A_20390 [Candidatus Kariarchaeaceae archaeon]|jgi:hypothetical protein